MGDMDVIFARLLQFHPDLQYLTSSPARTRVGPWGEALSPETFIVADHSVDTFDGLCRVWPDQETVRRTVEAIHQLELEAASRPPVINVTVAAPEGTPAPDGHFRVDTGPQTVTYVAGPAPEPDAGPLRGYHHHPRRAIQATRRLASYLRRLGGPAEVGRMLTGRDGSQERTEVIRAVDVP